MSLLVTCPNCGPREVSELRCAGESTRRPDDTPTRRELSEYVYFRDNEWGVQREWWFCRVCEDWFLAERHTYTNEVLETWLPEAVPAAPPAAPEPRHEQLASADSASSKT
jgi:sarcosine oxidase subunit delta